MAFSREHRKRHSMRERRQNMAPPPRHWAVRKPSPWVCRFAGYVPSGGRVLDLACGTGRHSRLFLERGHPVLAVDRDLSGLNDLTGRSGLETLETDLEDGRPFPLADQRFAGVVITNYLYRPLLPGRPAGP
jgi:SAM-dependent methyltransferase